MTSSRMISGEPFAPREPQTFYPREQQQQPQPQQYQPQPQPQQFPAAPQQAADDDEDVERLPSFITGGQPQQPRNRSTANGQGRTARMAKWRTATMARPDRFPLHRRRRRHRGPRDHRRPATGDGQMHRPAHDRSKTDSLAGG